MKLQSSNFPFLLSGGRVPAVKVHEVAQSAKQSLDKLLSRFPKPKTSAADLKFLLEGPEGKNFNEILIRLERPLSGLLQAIEDNTKNGTAFSASNFTEGDVEDFTAAISSLATSRDSIEKRNPHSNKIAFLKILTGICMVGAVIALIALLPPVAAAIPAIAGLSLVFASCEIGFLGVSTLAYPAAEFLCKRSEDRKGEFHKLQTEMEKLNCTLSCLFAIEKHASDVEKDEINSRTLAECKASLASLKDELKKIEDAALRRSPSTPVLQFANQLV